MPIGVERITVRTDVPTGRTALLQQIIPPNSASRFSAHEGAGGIKMATLLAFPQAAFGELLKSWERHLRAENRSPRTIYGYHESARQLIAFQREHNFPDGRNADGASMPWLRQTENPGRG